MSYVNLPPSIAPLFPLPGLFLFPGTAMPLRIFENRYRQMIEDLLDATGRLVIGTVLPGHENDLPGSPPIHPVAGLGEIVRHDRLPDGRFDILLYGLMRVSIREVASDRLYRKVQIERLEEHPVPELEQQPLRNELLDAVRERVKMPVQLPQDMPLSQLTDLLLISLRLPEEVMFELYSQPALTARAQGALQEHGQRPIDSQAIVANTFPQDLPLIDFSQELDLDGEFEDGSDPSDGNS
jgi:hypothetical protein